MNDQERNLTALKLALSHTPNSPASMIIETANIFNAFIAYGGGLKGSKAVPSPQGTSPSKDIRDKAAE